MLSRAGVILMRGRCVMGVSCPFAPAATRLSVRLCLASAVLLVVAASSGGGDSDGCLPNPSESGGSSDPGTASRCKPCHDGHACSGPKVSWSNNRNEDHNCCFCCNCNSLWYALNTIHHYCWSGDVTVTVNCNDTAELSRPFQFDNDISSLTIKGTSSREVVWLVDNATLSFGFQSNQLVKIENLEWIRNQTSTSATSLVFNGSMSVEVFNNTFMNARELGLQMIDLNGAMLIQSSVFECKGKGCGGVIVELSKPAIFTNVSFHNCTFVGLSDGAVSIAHNSGLLAADFTDCHFQDNSADVGGAISLDSSHVAHQQLTIDSCDFTNNSAAQLGGALSIALNPQHERDNRSSNPQTPITITNSNFTSNHAGSGGALALHVGGSDYAVCEQYCGSFIEAQNTTFADNSAHYAGSALWMTAVGNCLPMFVKLNDCTIEKNTILPPQSEDSFYGMGAVLTQGIPIRVEGSTVLCGNTGGSALVVSSATITFAGNGTVQFVNNSGYSGVALYLVGSSQMVLRGDVKLDFSHNVAIGDNIAIYHFSPTASPDPTEQCFVQFEGNVSDHFVHTNLTIFSNIPGACGDVLMEFKSFGPPQNISIVDNVKVILGDVLVLNCSVTDYFNNPVEAVVNSLLLEPDSMKPSVGFHFAGGDNLTVITPNSETTTQLRIVGREVKESETLVLELSLQSVPRVVATTKFTISHCRLGYYYNTTKQQCECESAKEHLFCQDANTARSSTCIQYGYWFGDPDGEFEGQDPESYLCPFANCNFTDKKQCSTGLENYAPFELSDDLCASNRHGFLCAKCTDNSSFNFNAHRCVQMMSCSGKETALVVFLHLFFWAFIGAVSVFVLKYHLRLGSGHLYCAAYYFALLRYVVQTSLHYEHPEALIHVLASPFDLYPDYFESDVCCTKDLSSTAVLAIHYVHPVILACLLTAIMIVFYLVNREEAKKRLVQAVCIFLFFSFTTLTETSVLLLRQPTFINHTNTNYGDGEYYVQESTGFYFKPGEYVLYRVLACLTLLFYSIPFTLLVLVSPYLFAKEVRIISWLRPVFEEFQMCYKKQYRSFAALYLVCRMVLFGIPVIGYEQVFLFQCFCVFVLIVHASLQPYSSLWLNAVDTVLLGDLTLFTLSLGLNANTSLFTGNKEVVTAIRWVLVILPGAYLLGLIGYQLVMVCIWPRLKKRMKKNAVTSTIVEVTDDVCTTEMESTPPSLRRYYQNPEALTLEREPLLFEESVTSNSYTQLEKEAAKSQNPLRYKRGRPREIAGVRSSMRAPHDAASNSSTDQHIGINSNTEISN